MKFIVVKNVGCNMKCPSCKKEFPLENFQCICGSYRVNENNHDKSRKECRIDWEAGMY